MVQRSMKGVGAVPASECVITGTQVGSVRVISVAGALDALTSPQLESAVVAAMQQKPPAVVVDLSDVDFLASAGMAVLVAAREQADGVIGFGVVAEGPATSRPLRLVGLADLIGMYATLEEALAALPGDLTAD